VEDFRVGNIDWEFDLGAIFSGRGVCPIPRKEFVVHSVHTVYFRNMCIIYILMKSIWCAYTPHHFSLAEFESKRPEHRAHKSFIILCQLLPRFITAWNVNHFPSIMSPVLLLNIHEVWCDISASIEWDSIACGWPFQLRAHDVIMQRPTVQLLTCNLCDGPVLYIGHVTESVP